MTEDLHLLLRERDLEKESSRVLTEEQKLIYRLAWHAGFAAGMEIAQDITRQTFRQLFLDAETAAMLKELAQGNASAWLRSIIHTEYRKLKEAL